MTPRVQGARPFGQISSAERRERQRGDSVRHQRARLLSAMVSIVSHGGYARTSIGELARRAGVSRGTFYEIFSEKEDCFLAAFAEHAERLEREIRASLGEGQSDALEAVAEGLCAFAGNEPEAFNFMFHEALLAGPGAAELREALITRLQKLVRGAEAGIEGGLDAPPELLLSAVLRLLTMQVNRDCLEAERIGPELRSWLALYRAPSGPLRWNALEPLAQLIRSPGGGVEAAALRRAVPKGRHGLSSEALRALQRERIAHGTAEAIREHGYADATVSDIVACAGVSRDVFYAEFRDKHEAFNEAAKLVFERLLATMASAYYGAAASAWPERVWTAGEAFARFLEEEPVLSYFLFVGTSAPHPEVDRVNEYVLAFKVFIDDGFEHSQPSGLPNIVSEVLVSAVLAIVTYQIRCERTWELRCLIPAIVHAVLVPFLGREEAASFVEARTRSAIATG